MEATKTLKNMAAIFKFVGIIPFFIVMILGARLIWIVTTVTPVTGSVFDIMESSDPDDDMITVSVSYQVGGILYFADLDVLDSNIFYGDMLAVYPKVSNPAELYQLAHYVFLTIPGFFSLIFLAVGFSIYPNQMRNERLMQYLRLNGKKLTATIIKVDHQRWMSVNTFSKTYHPIVISSRHKDSATGNETIYKTQRLWGFDDSKIVVGESKINVWVNQNNPRQYIVDHDTIKNIMEDPFE